MKKIMKMRKMMSDRPSFAGFSNSDGDNRFPEQPDTLLFLRAYIDECRKLKEKHLDYDTTAYVMHCDDEVKLTLKKNFDVVYDIRRCTKFTGIQSPPSSAKSTPVKSTRKLAIETTSSSVNENEKLFRENNKINFDQTHQIIEETDEIMEIESTNNECVLKRKRSCGSSFTINNNNKKKRHESALDIDDERDVVPDSTTLSPGMWNIYIKNSYFVEWFQHLCVDVDVTKEYNVI